MGLSSLFKRQSPVAPSASGGDAAQVVEAARASARRRLIGAVVLLGVGVIAFPLLFETQPRPIPVDIAIEIPRQDSAAPLTMPVPRPAAAVDDAASAVTAEPKLEAATEATAPASAAFTAAPQATLKPTAAAPAARPVQAAEASTAAVGRYVVQVGAYADAGGARAARAKVDKLGLRTYTQVIATDGGKRIRVRLGPFASRDEAEKAAAKVKAAGLPAAVLTL